MIDHCFKTKQREDKVQFMQRKENKEPRGSADFGAENLKIVYLTVNLIINLVNQMAKQ